MTSLDVDPIAGCGGTPQPPTFIGLFYRTYIWRATLRNFPDAARFFAMVAPRVLLHNGVEMPVLGFGCGGLLDSASIRHAVSLGYDLFDTAQWRQGNYFEEHLGEALHAAARNRSAVWITSKLAPRDLGEQPTLDAFPHSLRRLQTSYLDAFLLHAPRCWDCATPPNGTWRESWSALEQLYDRGALRALGVSNFSPTELRDLLAHARIKPHIVQDWMDPLHQNRELRALAAAHALQFQAFATNGYRHGTRRNPVLRHPVLTRLAGEVGRSVSQLVLRWALQHGVAVIPRSARPERMIENLGALDFSLGSDAMSSIDALDGTDPRDERSVLPPARVKACADHHLSCDEWADAGECTRNPEFMRQTCAGACDACAERVEL